MSENNETLSKFERLILSNQMRILEALYPDEADGIAIQREAIENGYELLYRWQAQYIYEGDDVMTSEECLEVWDTLDMFDAINRAIERLEKSEYRENWAATFAGYDGNYESKFMAFAAYTVQRLRRFEYVPLRREGHWNSHSPMRGVYGRMRSIWDRCSPDHRHNLSEAELQEILAAAVHPDSRQEPE